jgi:hypothetical protein
MKLNVLVGRSQRGYRLLMVLVLLARWFSPFMFGRTESSLAKAEAAESTDDSAVSATG